MRLFCCHKNFIIIIFGFTLSIIGLIDCEVLDLTDQNFDHYISTYEVVFVNFHAEWCRFSELLIPILQESDQIINKEFGQTNRILIGRVDCDQNPHLSARYRIVKYPTIKTFINGKVTKKEYRSQRNAVAITQYIRDILSDPVIHIEYKSYDDMSAVFYNKSAIIGYFGESPKRHPKYSIFRRVATDLREFCQFFWVTNSPFLTQDKHQMLAFKSYRSTKQSEYDFMYETYDELSSWSTYLCIPIVREISFENAEEMVEEGLPLVILFHKSDDEKSVEMFKTIVQKELINESSTVNFVTADGNVFEHPLHHINKSLNDLPLIAIDSFQHMFLFPKFEDLSKTRILANFIEDLKSGKLHRQYHFGPEYDDNAEEEQTEEVVTSVAEENQSQNNVSEEFLTPVANSVFKKLAPSEYRYTLLRDEL